MRILALAWEFPPRIVGGIARHVGELYPEIVQLGHHVDLLTVEFGQTPYYEVVDGIHVHRVRVMPGHDFFHWVGNMNNSLGQYGGKLLSQEGPFDLIHAHDWLVGDAAIALKHIFRVPLIATIHATEAGRHNGLHNSTQHYIHGKELRFAHEAWRIIVCSRYMQQEVERSLRSPNDKVDVVYNGIRPEKKPNRSTFDYLDFRRRFAKDDEQIVYYVGRITYEKGVQVLLRAAPYIIKAMDRLVKFVVIGTGQIEPLKKLATDLGIQDYCCFTGFMPDEDLNLFQSIADCAVFPSLYEPFGIVVLESFAAQVPVVVSDVGGLPEVVQHRTTGIVTQANSSTSLATGILQILQDPEFAKGLVDRAYQDLQDRFSWGQLASETSNIYERIAKERQMVAW
ncbi:glycosyltransferase family 4 protein [Vacuolonema iberomarrocanum]|uniref:glycosyltransferase family 4 protein n=1 Tax=Vacuolonema iberomarrocanum TaxID=3454632 RepID=UPI0019F61379|nr:glycosyltransferase family 4 protein [filamentous cyanobacterium LEGE 07170]